MNFTEEQINHIIELAKFLVDEDNINKEYNRALSELIADIDGKPDVCHADRSEEVLNNLLTKNNQQ